MNDDKIFNLIQNIGFELVSKYPPVYCSYQTYYTDYSFSKNFSIGKVNPNYTLKHHNEVLLSSDNKEDVYNKLTNIFKKELRLLKISKIYLKF